MKFIYVSLLCLISSNVIALEWEKIASHRYYSDYYVVYKTQNEHNSEIAKLCIENFFGETFYEYPLNVSTAQGTIRGHFEFYDVFGQKTLLYSHTFHDQTAIAQLFNLDDHDSNHSLLVYTSYLDIDRLAFKQLPIEKKLKIVSTEENPVYDSAYIEIVNWSKGVSWNLTENGNLSATQVATKSWHIVSNQSYAWFRDFEAESILTEDVPNTTVYFEGPWSKDPGQKIIEDKDHLLKTYTIVEEGEDFEWITIYTAQINSNRHIRISYLEDTITDCHACPTKVKAQILSEPAGKVIKELELNVGTAWGKATSSFRLHNNNQLLSYEFHYGNQGNNSSYLYFFNVENLTSDPIAHYSYRVSVDHGLDWNEIPQTVKNEFISCTPFDIASDAYIHHGSRFYPGFDLNENGDLVLSYSGSVKSFEPISWEHCREYMEYTLPDRIVTLEGPLSDSPGKFISVENAPVKQTGFDLEANEGGEYYDEILKGTQVD